MLVDFFRQLGGYPVGEDTAPQYDWQRGQVASSAVSGIFDVIGNMGSQMTNAWAARDYAEKAAAAQQRAYENARKIAAAQKESLLLYSSFVKDEKLKNIARLETNAANLRTLAETEKTRGMSSVLKMTGDAKSEYAASGVKVGTGSVQNVMQNLLEIGDRTVRGKYSERVNQIGQILTTATQEKIDANMVEWSAKERARFLDANTDIRLY